ncbi:MAG: hypothetical protein Roseis2KO_37260 [Roseivirga sp.]
MTFTVLLLGFCTIYFLDYAVPTLWLVAGFGTVVLFVILYNQLTIRWHRLSAERYASYIFRLNLILGVIVVALCQMAFFSFGQNYFEPGAADSVIYHKHGSNLAEMFLQLDFRVSKYLTETGLDDFGFPVYLGVLYAIFGPSPVVVFAFNIFLHAFSAQLVFKITTRAFPLPVAKSASLLMSIFPIFLIYEGILLKEILMIFLLLASTHYGLVIFENNRLLFIKVLLFLVATISLFFFRTVLGICFLAGFFIFTGFQLWHSGSYRFIKLAAILVVASSILIYLVNTGILNEILLTADRSVNQMDAELADKASRGQGLSFNKVIIGPLIGVSSLVAPFSTLVFLDEQVLIVWNFPSTLMKNILSFFALMGIWNTFRHELKRFALPLFFTIFYTIVLIASAQVTSQRFQLVIWPFLCIFMANGLYTFNRKKINVWYLYLVALTVVLFAWNFFKLYIRDL